MFGREPKSKPKSKVKLMDLYDNLVATSKTLNDSRFCIEKKTEPDQFSIDFSGAYCNELITYYYVIERLPRSLSLSFKDDMRHLCKDNVRISFIDYIRPHRIEWDSPKMRSKLRIMRHVGEEKKNMAVDAYNMHETLGTVQSQQWVEESLAYLADADVSRHRGLLKSSICVVISGKRNVDFDKTIKAVVDYAQHTGIKLSRVLYNVPDVMQAYSPFAHTFVQGVSDVMPSAVLSDEILARFNTYSQGILGAGGLYFGSDIYSGFPVLKVVKRNWDDPENILITAETGGGKSFAVKLLIFELLAAGFVGTIMDVEGTEYQYVGEYVATSSQVQRVNMAEGTGKYFDPVEIAPPCGVVDIDSSAKSMSMNFTLATFKVLLGAAYNNDEWLDTVIDDAVGKTYSNAGVTNNPNTWSKSHSLSMFDVYHTLKTSMKGYRTNPEYTDAVEKAVAMLSRYFEKDGTRADLFKDRVRISDVANADLVICSFGMEGKSESAVDKVQLALMQLGAAQFSHQRSIFAKARGKCNFKIWEEFQRWGKFPDSDKTIGVAVTGGRKIGDINIIITNKVKDLLGEQDKFGIFDNLQSFIVGAIGAADVRERLCKQLSIPNMLPELNKINAASTTDDFKDVEGVGTADSVYKHSFLVGLDRNKYGVVRFIVPPAIAKSQLFYTGVKKGTDK